MSTGGRSKAKPVLLTILLTWLMVFHIMGCDNGCDFDLGLYKGSNYGITYQVFINWVEDDTFGADITFIKNKVPFTCKGCEFEYWYGTFKCYKCGESPDDLQKLVEYGNMGSTNYLGMSIADGCLSYYMTSQGNLTVELYVVG
ncbi:hypothetical protein FOL47_006363 [Perkinsus chesapeaki]|uniref:Uncharacterized protein n=1 Tax=Perkinsus chesapeaki TaxID=330153 RepID=A0A7J6LSV5_PERCH|nr:hypothetical protein FOL47_006363 [Perkinsus chesapeaki]